MNVRRILFLVLSLATVSAILAAVSMSRDAREAGAQGEDFQASVALDMDATNGSGPCDPIDDSRNAGVGETVQIAVCLVDAPSAPAGFQFDLLYDDTLSECVPSGTDAEGSLDSNPDANAGATTWGDSSLGTGWNCYWMEVTPPSCDRDDEKGANHGFAWLKCLSTQDLTLPAGEDVAAPLALVDFKAIATGADAMALRDVHVVDEGAIALLLMRGPTESGSLAIEGVVTPTPTPTVGLEATATPAPGIPSPDPGAGPTATAAAATAVAQGTPIASINQAATATSVSVATKAAAAAKTPKATPGSTTDNGDDSSGPPALLIAAIIVAAGAVVAGGGWFGYRRFRSR